MNFMDYTGDNCMALFTNGQSARFQAVMQNADFRKNLKNLTCYVTQLSQKPLAKFTYIYYKMQHYVLLLKVFNFTDKSLFAPTSWSWTFQGGTPSTSSVKNPTSISV
jgi:PKD repeat protein